MISKLLNGKRGELFKTTLAQKNISILINQAI